MFQGAAGAWRAQMVLATASGASVAQALVASPGGCGDFAWRTDESIEISAFDCC